MSGLESLIGCQYVSGRTNFQGALSGSEITASANATFDCPAPNGMVICNDVAVTIRGRRR